MADEILFTFEDPQDEQYLEVVAMEHGAVRLKIYGAGKVTSTRCVDLPPSDELGLALALASHIHTEGSADV